MRSVVFSKSLITASGNCIAAQQTVAAAGNVVLNGGSVTAGVATLDTQRRVAIISDGNDSTITATITGTRQGGQPISEVLALTNAGTAVSVLDYLNIGTISVSGAVASHVTIGTNGSGSTDWIMPNFHLTPFNVNITDQLSGTVNWNLETTQDTYWDPPRGTGATTPQPHVTQQISASAIAQAAILTSAVTGYRFTVNSGTGTLSVQATQAGIIN